MFKNVAIVGYFHCNLRTCHHSESLPLLSATGLVLEEVTSSITDWYPTLLSAAGIETTYPRSRRLHGTDSLDMRFEDDDMEPLDGMDLWPAISTGDLSDAFGGESESREILIDLDGASGCQYSSCGAIRAGNWKFIRGSWSENTRQRFVELILWPKMRK